MYYILDKSNAIQHRSLKYVSISIHNNRYYLYLCFTYFFIISFVFTYNGLAQFEDFVIRFAKSLMSFVKFSIITILIYCGLILIKDRPSESPSKHLFKVLSNGLLAPQNIFRCIVPIIGIVAVISTFLIFKGAIPKIIPFAYDETFEHMDRVLHFGYQPWQLLQYFLGNEWITLLIHRNYYIWFAAIYIVFLWQCGTKQNPKLRMQYILSFAASWIFLGSFTALLLSSAGPIYYHLVTPDNHVVYKAGMDYLSMVDEKHGLVMMKIKDVLWYFYMTNEGPDTIKGISAMPSMHVALAFLMALLGWQKGGWIKIGFTIFAILTFLGSIHLLWHYAVDGYVSIIGVLLIWWVSGKIANLTVKEE